MRRGEGHREDLWGMGVSVRCFGLGLWGGGLRLGVGQDLQELELGAWGVGLTSLESLIGLIHDLQSLGFRVWGVVCTSHSKCMHIVGESLRLIDSCITQL